MKTMKLASAGEEVKIWEAPSYFLVNQYNPDQSTSVRSVAWSPDGQQIASVPNAGEKVLLTLVKHSALHNIEVSPGDVVTYAVFNNLSSRFLGFGCKSGNIIVWDLKSQKARRSYLGHRDEITCLHFNWNDSYVASGSVTGDILLHNVTTGHTSAPLRNAKAQAIRGLEYGFIKKSLLGSVSDDGSVSLWDVNSRQLMHGFTAAHSAPATGLVFSPVNNILLISVGLDKKIISYDVQMKNHVKSFSCDAPLTAVDFMDDGVTLAVGTSRGKVHIYDLRLSSMPVKTLAAHNISVHSLAFQNISNRILSQGEYSKKKSQHNLEPAQNRDFENGDVIRSNAVVTYSGISTAASVQPSSISSPSHSMPAVYVDTVCPGRSVCDVFSPVRDGIYKTFDRQNSPITYGEQRDSGSFSQTVFSPLQESTVNSNVRRQPIGGGSQNSSHLLGDRPVTTGLAESDEEKNNSVAPITLPEMPVSVNSFYYTTISEESNCSQKPASASPTKNSAEKVISQTSTEALAKCTSFLDDVLENDKFGQDHRTEPCGGSSSAGLDTVTSSNHLDSPSTMDRPDVMGATGEEGAGDISSDKWRITDLKESSINGWQDDGDTKKEEPKSQSLPSKRITCRKPWSIITSGNQEPQAWDKCLESQDVEESKRLASPQAFQAEFVHQVVRDAMEEFRDSVHRDLFSLHVEVIRQFHNQMAEIHNLVRQYSVNDELLAELERLREENKQLKATF